MILVTGGAGFIGSHLVEQLTEEHEIVVLDNLSVGDQNLELLKKLKARFIKGDVRDARVVEEVVRGCETVFHLAAMNRAARSIERPLEANAINVNGTLNVLDACRKNDAKLVFASSSSAYGGSVKENKEDQPLKPLHPYGVGKLAGEAYCRVYCELYGLPTVSLRYVSVYGPRQRGDIEYAAVISKFIRQLFAGEPLTVYGSGEQTRQFTFVKDAVEATVIASQKKEALGEVFNIASPETTSVNDIVKTLTEITGMELKVKKLPPVKGDPKTNAISTEKAKRVIGFTAKYTFEKGLAETVEWYKRNTL